MFNDDEPLAFKKMHEFSAVDGFSEITESLAEMIKFVASEPSVGLFYIQQHTQSAVPNLINLKKNIEEKSREVALHAEDCEDSITMIRSMKDTGAPLANEMIKDLRHSLTVMLKKKPKKGLMRQPDSAFQIGRACSWSPATGYLSNGFRSANALSAAEAGFPFWVSEANDEELPLSNPTNNEIQVNKSMFPDRLHYPSSENYEKVMADENAKLKGQEG